MEEQEIKLPRGARSFAVKIEVYTQVKVEMQLNDKPAIRGRLTALFTVSEGAKLRIAVSPLDSRRWRIECVFDVKGYWAHDAADLPPGKKYEKTFKMIIV